MDKRIFKITKLYNDISNHFFIVFEYFCELFINNQHNLVDFNIKKQKYLIT